MGDSKRLEEIDQGPTFERLESLEPIANTAGFAAVGENRLLDIGCTTVVQEELTLRQSPQRRGPPFVTHGRSHFHTVFELGSHVVK